MKENLVNLIRMVLTFCFLLLTLTSLISSEWQQCNTPNNEVVNQFVNIGSTLYVSTKSGLYRSSDYCLSWEKVSDTIKFNCLFALDKTLLASPGQGVYRSSDFGKTWQLTGLADKTILSFANHGTTIFAGVLDGIYRSDYDGESWSSKNWGEKIPYFLQGLDTFYKSFAPVKMICQGTHFFALNIPKTGLGMFFSSNYGLNWSDLSYKVFDVFVNNNIFYVSRNQGLLVTDDVNKIVKISSLDILQNGIIGDVTCFAKSNQLVFASTSKNIYLTETEGKSWFPLKCDSIMINENIGQIKVVDSILFEYNNNKIFKYEVANYFNNYFFVSNDTIRLNHKLNNKIFFTITTKENTWHIEKSKSWIDCSSSSGQSSEMIYITAKDNMELTPRTMDLNIIGSNGQNKTIVFIQAGVPQLELSSNLIFCSASFSNSQTFSIESNIEWNVENSQNWVSVDRKSGVGNDTLHIIVEENTNSIGRNAKLFINTKGDYSIERQISILQKSASTLSNEIEEQSNSQFNISPNPSSDFINLTNIAFDSRIELLNLLGVIVWSGIGQNQIDIKSIQNGIYIIRAINGKQVHSKEIVINR